MWTVSCFSTACWNNDPKQRPLFEEIVPQLSIIAESAFASTDNDSFLAMQRVWQEEIQALFLELSEKEQVSSLVVCVCACVRARVCVCVSVSVSLSDLYTELV